MELALEILAWATVVTVAVPLLVLAAESWAAAARRLPTPAAPTAGSPRVAVLIPAHNEEDGLPRTLAALMPQLRPGDRCLVVADNCTDRTAEVARAAGAEVLERTDPVHRGKGFALDAGIRVLSADAPEVLVLIDADCDVAPGAVAALAAAAGAGRPVQGINVLHPPPAAGLKGRLSAFAFYFKNVIRPLGLSRLGGPCHLFGTGLALPWRLLPLTRLATGNIVEDLQLGIDLTRAGYPARFLPVPCVSGELPAGDRAAASQRKRWEHGHVQTLTRHAPRLVATGLVSGRPLTFLLGLDLLVPPLSLLGLATAAAVALSTGLWAVMGDSGPVALGAAAVGLASSGMFFAWLRHGRSWVSWSDLARIPVYVAWKVPIYLNLLFRPQRAWVRAERPTDRTAGRVGDSEPDTVSIDGLSIHALDEAATVRHILCELAAGRGGWVATPNLDYLRRYRRSGEFRTLIDETTLRVPDGMPLLWAARLQGTPLPGRVAGSSLISTLSAGAAAAGRSIYLLGGEPGAAAGAAAVLQGRYPGLTVLGTSAPRVPDPLDAASVETIAKAIEAAGQPDIVFVGIGSPKTERLIAALRHRLPRTWWLGVGVSFSFLTGQVSRAPHWLQAVGLEWAYRLYQEPRRLARRYLIDGIPFAFAMLTRAVLRPVVGGGRHGR